MASNVPGYGGTGLAHGVIVGGVDRVGAPCKGRAEAEHHRPANAATGRATASDDVMCDHSSVTGKLAGSDVRAS